MQGQGGGAPMWSVAVHWVRGVSRVVWAKISPNLCFAWGTLPEPYSNLRWLLVVLGLEITR